jgi:hypothetical protein
VTKTKTKKKPRLVMLDLKLERKEAEEAVDLEAAEAVKEELREVAEAVKEALREVAEAAEEIDLKHHTKIESNITREEVTTRKAMTREKKGRVETRTLMRIHGISSICMVPDLNMSVLKSQLLLKFPFYPPKKIERSNQIRRTSIPN